MANERLRQRFNNRTPYVPTTQEGAKDTRSSTTGADLQRRRSTTKPISGRVREGTNRPERGPLIDHRK